jgi:hypothetical protein
MLHQLKWDDLIIRRHQSKATMIYRVIDQLVTIPSAPYLRPTGVRTRGNDMRFLVPFTSVNSLVKHRWYTASIVTECEACRSSLYCFDFTDVCLCPRVPHKNPRYFGTDLDISVLENINKNQCILKQRSPGLIYTGIIKNTFGSYILKNSYFVVAIPIMQGMCGKLYVLLTPFWCQREIISRHLFLKIWINAWILKMYSRSAKGGEKADPNRNPWLAKMMLGKKGYVFMLLL